MTTTGAEVERKREHRSKRLDGCQIMQGLSCVKDLVFILMIIGRKPMGLNFKIKFPLKIKYHSGCNIENELE